MVNCEVIVDEQKTLSNISLAIITLMIVSVTGMMIFVQCSNTMPEGSERSIVTSIEDVGEEIVDEVAEQFFDIDLEIDINGNDK